MKKLILLAFVLLPVLLSGQVLKGTGISYFDSIPNVAPSLPKGTEIALGIKTKKLYRWDRTCSCWIELETSTDSLARTVLASGLFNEYAVPFGGSTGKLDQSAAFQFVLGQLQANSFATLGSAGAGYVGLSPQSSVPATPASGIRVYADASGRFGWIGTNEYTRVFDASGITANRIFKLQNKTYTLADSADVASLSASLPSAYFPLPGGTLTGTGGAGFVGFPAQSSAPSAPGAGFRVFANGAGNMGVIRSDGYVTTFDFSTATGNRFFTYPANAGTFGILENTQSWTGVNTFAPTGTGGAGFMYSSTTRPSHPFGTVTTAQRDAMTGMSAGDGAYNATTKRFNFWDVSWLEVPTMASGGIGNNQVVRGNSSGNLIGDANLVYSTYLAVRQAAGAGTNAFSVRTNNGNFGVDAGPISEGSDRWLINGVGDYLTLSGNNKVGLYAAGSSKYIGVGAYDPGSASLRIFYGETFLGSSTDVGMQANGNYRIGMYHTGVDAAIPAFTFNSSGTALSSNANVGYFRVLHGGTMRFQVLGANGFFGFGSTTPTSFAHFAPPASNVTGDLSGAGYGFRLASATYNNSTSLVGAVVPLVSVASFDGGVLGSSSAGISYTEAATVTILGAPTAVSSVNIPTPYAFLVNSGHARFKNLVSIGNNTDATTTGALNVIARGDSDGIRIFSGNNPNGGSVSPPSINFYRSVSTSSLSSYPYLRISSQFNGNIFSGDMVNNNGTTVTNWMSLTHGLTTIPSGTIFQVVTLGVFGTEPSAATAPADGFITSGRKINGGTSDISGSNFYIDAGFGSGSSTLKGNIFFRTPDATTSGATLQTVTTKFSVGRTSVYSTMPTAIGATSVNAAALLDLVSTTRGLLIPRATNAQIAAVPSPPLALQMFSSDDERIHLKRTSGFFQIAYTQDVKRDTSYQITNTNLDISGQTANFKNRYHTVRIATAVTAAATANNVITMPVPHADLLGINFKVSVVDVSGDSDISQLSFGTDGVDGYLSNGDGTYALTQNLYPGLGVYVSVAWDQNKSAYRWFLQ